MADISQATTAEIPSAAPPAGWLARTIGLVAVGLALLSAVVTFLVLSNLTPILPTDGVNRALLWVNACTDFFLIAVIAWELWRVLQARRHGRAGSRLHIRIVTLFSVIAAAPAILMAVVASITVDRGFDRLFSRQTQSLIENAAIMADAYLGEHLQNVRSDTIATAIELARAKPLYDQNHDQFKQFVNAQARIRGLPVITILDKDLNVIDQAEVPLNQALVNTFTKPPREALGSVGEREPEIGVFLESNYVAAVIKLQVFTDTYLYVARLLDPRVVAQVQVSRESALQFAQLRQQRDGMQFTFASMYAVIALSVLLSAVWFGLTFANYLAAPIRRLIGAAQLVSTGNLQIQVPTRRSEGDLAQLGETFNKMTHDLRTQRDDIVRARDLIDSRRRFTEAVLAGASAGVIGVDGQGRISILNRSAEHLIGHTEAEVLTRPLGEVVPELIDLFTIARTGSQRLIQGQVTINRGGRDRNLNVRVTRELSGEADQSHHVITLDDITELVAAQRTSAWADIARRIAHEIKNPLTPIQISAERLRRRYGPLIKDESGVFQQCTDTIVRQVDDIKRMVDEFSQFARMPKPVIGAEDAADVVRQAVFLQRVGNADIDIDVEFAEDPMPARFDRRLISQAVTNIIKNATEAIAAVPAGEIDKGRILVSASRDGGDILIDVIDNGIGLPKEHRSRLLEPYVTTREKGTGLGLAIVGRILEEHGGKIELHDAAERAPGQRGAWMRLRFAAAPVAIEHERKVAAAGH